MSATIQWIEALTELMNSVAAIVPVHDHTRLMHTLHSLYDIQETDRYARMYRNKAEYSLAQGAKPGHSKKSVANLQKAAKKVTFRQVMSEAKMKARYGARTHDLPIAWRGGIRVGCSTDGAHRAFY